MRKIVDGVLTAVGVSRGGVYPPHNKNTADRPIERMPFPKLVVLPMTQCIGAPCVPTVKPGDPVNMGQVIGDTDKFMGAPIHASISGRVVSVGEVHLANGLVTTGVTIESDGGMRLDPGLKPPTVNSREELIQAVRASGLVGLGGAGFPTHVKLSYPEDKGVDTLVINAAECEPYITVDYRECLEHPADIIDGILLLKRHLGFKRIVIAAEDNKSKAFDVLREISALDDRGEDRIKLMVLKSKYPQGAEKMMVFSATGRRVPPGKLPADVGVVVVNVASIAFIGRYMKTGKPLISRSITVDGTAIVNPKNVRVPIGTSLRDIVSFCGGFSERPRKIVCGGPMMGLALTGIDAPILKQNNALLAFADDPYLFKRERACIRCGRCVSVCPMSLEPTLIERFARARDIDRLKRVSVNVCMECGSCAYACPSGRPLVQYMRLAKQLMREEAKK